LFSFKPAAVPLMDAGKALARSGEVLIEWTTAVDLYGGALSAAGAQLRNAGDSVAQAAASCRFKTGTELVCDELREAGTCLTEGVGKMQQAAAEARVDEWETLADKVEEATVYFETCGTRLEAAGAAIMQRQSVEAVGVHLVAAGTCLEGLSLFLKSLVDESDKKLQHEEAQAAAELAGQRMAYAAETMIQSGNNLQGIQPKATAKNWLKGGGGGG
jgi:hypothetical protein